MSTLETSTMNHPVTSTASSSPLTSPNNPMAMPLMKPLQMLGLNMGLLDNRSAAAAAAAALSAAQTKTHLTTKIKTAGSGSLHVAAHPAAAAVAGTGKKPDRSKFAPY